MARRVAECQTKDPQISKDQPATFGNPELSFASSLISPKIVTGGVALIDFVLISACSSLIFFLYVEENIREIAFLYLAIVLFLAITGPILFNFVGLYSLHMLKGVSHQISRLWSCWTFLFSLILIAFFFAKVSDDYSRAWIAMSYAGGFSVLMMWRIVLAIQLRAWMIDGKIGRRTVIFGGGMPGRDLIERLEKSSTTDIKICGLFDDRHEDRIPEGLNNYPKLGNIDELITFTRLHKIDLLIVTLPITAEKRLLQILNKLWVLPIDIRLSAHSTNLKFRPRTYSYIGNVPFFDVCDNPITDWNYVYKWLFDKIIAVFAIAILSPLMLLVAIAVKLDSKGPALFRQQRMGFNNELIEIYKFRSMYHDQSDGTASRLVTRDDDRITRVGRIIRKLSLDELPQLFNVLGGSLSLVGPRPHALEAKAENKLYQNVVDGYFARHRVKPGITGWAQVNGFRGETDTEEKIQSRVEFDLHYIENWSILFDFYILMITPFALLNTKNAY